MQDIHASLVAIPERSTLPAPLPLQAVQQAQLASTCAQQAVLQPEAVKRSALYAATKPSIPQVPQLLDGKRQEPFDLVTLNHERYNIGRNEFEQFGKATIIQSTPQRQGPVTVEKLFTFPEATEQLKQAASKQQTGPRESPCVTASTVSAWMEGFKALLDEWTVTPSDNKTEKQSRQTEAHALLLTLKNAISNVGDANRRVLYMTATEQDIEHIFDKLRIILGSVSVEKEIQAFEEELEDLGLT